MIAEDRVLSREDQVEMQADDRHEHREQREEEDQLPENHDLRPVIAAHERAHGHHAIPEEDASRIVAGPQPEDPRAHGEDDHLLDEPEAGGKIRRRRRMLDDHLTAMQTTVDGFPGHLDDIPRLLADLPQRLHVVRVVPDPGRTQAHERRPDLGVSRAPLGFRRRVVADRPPRRLRQPVIGSNFLDLPSKDTTDSRIAIRCDRPQDRERIEDHQEGKQRNPCSTRLPETDQTTAAKDERLGDPRSGWIADRVIPIIRWMGHSSIRQRGTNKKREPPSSLTNPRRNTSTSLTNSQRRAPKWPVATGAAHPFLGTSPKFESMDRSLNQAREIRCLGGLGILYGLASWQFRGDDRGLGKL